MKGFGKVAVGTVGKKSTLAVGKADLGAVAKKPAAMGRMDLGTFGKKTPFGKKSLGVLGKKAAPGNEGESHGLLEGISSLHSWIKSQTMMRPGMKVTRRIEPVYDPVDLSSTYVFI